MLRRAKELHITGGWRYPSPDIPFSAARILTLMPLRNTLAVALHQMFKPCLTPPDKPLMCTRRQYHYEIFAGNKVRLLYQNIEMPM